MFVYQGLGLVSLVAAVTASSMAVSSGPGGRPVNVNIDAATSVVSVSTASASGTGATKSAITLLPFGNRPKPTDAPDETTLFLEFIPEGEAKTVGPEQWMNKYADVFDMISQPEKTNPLDTVMNIPFVQGKPSIPGDLPEKIEKLSKDQIEVCERDFIPAASKDVFIPWFLDADPDTHGDCMMRAKNIMVDQESPNELLTYLGVCEVLDLFSVIRSDKASRDTDERGVGDMLKDCGTMIKGLWNTFIKGQPPSEMYKEMEQKKLEKEAKKKAKEAEKKAKEAAKKLEEEQKKAGKPKLAPRWRDRTSDGVNVNSTVPGANVWNWIFHGVPLINPEQWDPSWQNAFINRPVPEEYKNKDGKEEDKKDGKKESDTVQERGLWDDRSIEEKGLWDDRSVEKRGLWDDRSIEEKGLWDDRSIEEKGLWDDRAVVEKGLWDDKVKARGIFGVDGFKPPKTRFEPSPFPTLKYLVDFVKIVDSDDKKMMDKLADQLTEEQAQELTMLMLGSFVKSAFRDVEGPKAEAE